MNPNLSRKDRRQISAKASKLYGVKPAHALPIYQAYQMLDAGDGAGAAAAIAPAINTVPDNIHPWLILGKIALSELNGQEAFQFYGRAAEINDRSHRAHVGIATSYFLLGKPFESVCAYEDAISRGTTDKAALQTYSALMEKMGREKEAAHHLQKVAQKAGDSDLCFKVAEMLYRSEEYARAAEIYEEVAEADSRSRIGEISKIKSAFLNREYVDVIGLIEAWQVHDSLPDEMVSLAMNSLRLMGRYDDALAYVDSHEFSEPVYYQRALAVSGHIFNDQGSEQKAIDAFEEAMNVSDVDRDAAAAPLGSIKLRNRDIEAGAALYARRLSNTKRTRIPYENAESQNLASLERVFLIGEQGVGDHLALLPMALAALKEMTKSEIHFVCEERTVQILKSSSLGINMISSDEFESGAYNILPQELVYLGDMVRHFKADMEDGEGFCGYLQPDAKLSDELRADYKASAGDRPVIGVSWKSKSLVSGYARSVSLSRMLESLPQNAYVVNLQYEDDGAELASLSEKFPGMTFYTDKRVDQMQDLIPYVAQVAAMDAVVSIDNTTAHFCGALGRPQSHILLPKGAERFWYWGPEGDVDIWYGCLNMYGQDVCRDWDSAFLKLKNNVLTEE